MRENYLPALLIERGKVADLERQLAEAQQQRAEYQDACTMEQLGFAHRLEFHRKEMAGMGDGMMALGKNEQRERERAEQAEAECERLIETDRCPERDINGECVAVNEAEQRAEQAEEAVVLMYEHLLPRDHDGLCLDCNRIFREAGLDPDAPRERLASLPAAQAQGHTCGGPPYGFSVPDCPACVREVERMNPSTAQEAK